MRRIRLAPKASYNFAALEVAPAARIAVVLDRLGAGNPAQTRRQASHASTPSPPEELPPPAETKRKSSATRTMAEKPEKPTQTAIASPPVAPPTPPPPHPPLRRRDQGIVETLPDSEPVGSRADTGRSLVAFLVSALVHAGLMILLAMLVAVSHPGSPWGNHLTLSATVDEPDLDVEQMLTQTPAVNTVRRHDAHVSLPPSPIPDVNPISELSVRREVTRAHRRRHYPVVGLG